MAKTKVSKNSFDFSARLLLSLTILEGAALLSMQSVLCEVVMASGKTYKVRSFTKSAKLIEFNDKLAKDIDILVNKPE